VTINDHTDIREIKASLAEDCTLGIEEDVFGAVLLDLRLRSMG
jgi:hypothetical protein